MTPREALHRWLLTYGLGAVAAVALVAAVILVALVILKRRHPRP